VKAVCDLLIVDIIVICCCSPGKHQQSRGGYTEGAAGTGHNERAASASIHPR